MKQPLLEAIPFEIVEGGIGEIEHNGQKFTTVKGIMHRANERNGNNSIYPAPVLFPRTPTELALSGMWSKVNRTYNRKGDWR